MKTKLFKKKKSNKVCITLLILTAVGGACALAATHLKKQRAALCAKMSSSANVKVKTGERPLASGCQKMGQNETIPGKTDISANSSEWERGVS